MLTRDLPYKADDKIPMYSCLLADTDTTYNRTSSSMPIDDDRPRYKHEVLDIEEQQIRLLRIRRYNHSNTSEVDCELQHFTLGSQQNESLKYSALSYTWGATRQDYRIRINGGMFSVGENLFCFCAQYSRSESSEDPYWTGWIWVDQICINQSEDNERNHQVKLMSTIYGNASNTIIWLHDHGIYKRALSAYIAKGDSVQGDLTHANKTSGDVVPNSRFFVLHRYFTRLWIVQEVLLSSQLDVLVEGGHWMLWSDLNQMFENFRTRDSNTFAATSVCTARSFISLKAHLDSINNPRLHIGQTRFQHLDLLECLGKFSTGDCHDLRDKIFGLMGLVREEQRVEIDYTKSIRGVLIDVLLKVAERNLDRAGRLTLIDLADELDLPANDRCGWDSLIRSIYNDDTAEYLFAPEVRATAHWGKRDIDGIGYVRSCWSRAASWWYELEGHYFEFECLRSFY